MQSLRQTFVEYRGLSTEIDFDELEPPPPAALDLKLTNACNLKCRICGPVASSSWLQEELSVTESEPIPWIAYLRGERTYFLSNKLTRQERNLSELRRWLPHLQYLELTGGEPMMSPENRELVELIANEGRPEQVGILFNTNATVIDDRILRNLDRFREVKVCCSIDDIGPRFEYERFPARWADVEANLTRYQDVALDGWHLYAFCSVSVFNVWYLPEYIEWLRSRADDTPMELVLNFVHYPRHFSVQVLPAAVKSALAERLQRYVLDDESLPEAFRLEVEDLLAFVRHSRPDDAAAWQEAVDTIVERDQIRGQDARREFPELFHELERHRAWTPGGSGPEQTT